MSKASHEPSKLGWLVAGTVIVVVFWLATPTIMSLSANLGGGKLPERGQFGDQYGSVNALFTGLALLGLLYSGFQNQSALRQNSEALSISREELENTRKELRAAQEGLEEQRKLTDAQNSRLQEQQFDQTFFNLLKSCMDAREGVRFSTYSGIDAVHNCGRHVDFILDGVATQHDISTQAQARKTRLNIDIFCRPEGGPNSFVDQAVALISYTYQNSPDKHGIYAQILRSAFSASELKILFAASLARSTCGSLEEIACRLSLFVGLTEASVSIVRYLDVMPKEAFTLE
jgi:hypothetical protein